MPYKDLVKSPAAGIFSRLQTGLFRVIFQPECGSLRNSRDIYLKVPHRLRWLQLFSQTKSTCVPAAPEYPGAGVLPPIRLEFRQSPAGINHPWHTCEPARPALSGSLGVPARHGDHITAGVRLESRCWRVGPQKPAPYARERYPDWLHPRG